MAALPPWGLYVRDGYAWPRGAAAAHLCRASGLSLLLGLFASALTLSWISVERCAVVLAPASAALLRSPRVSAAALCASWLPSAALAALLTADVSAYARANGTGGATVCGYAAEDRFAMWSLGNRPGRGLLLNLVGFALPFAVLGASYGAVCRRLCALSRFGGSRIPKDSVLRLLFALTVVFCVTWCPYTAVNLYSSGGGGFGGVRSGDERTANTVGELCMAVGLLNSALNPLLYCLWTRRNWQQLLPRVPALCATRRPARVGASV
ncbi:type-1 angiotensin II receptor A-like [Lethenteron reissneri]|uniref:type-1 angiotensin II receptor A-like n=1 Tax=Lethenteron reissneri TaxID=7753 RepID=UPI002AB78D25|nr:type-1 angiotensin II receptor A-like [Lethenteron reissneri]